MGQDSRRRFLRNSRSRRVVGRPAYSLIVLGALSIFALSGCGVIKKKPESQPSELQLVGKPMQPEQAKEVLSEVGSNFAYGPGLGDAAVTVGTVVVFPPYALYLLGNAVLSLSGYEPVTVSSMLPPDEGKAWSDTYDSVVSGPGKVVAAVAGHEYRSREVADDRMRKLTQEIEASNVKASQVKTLQ